jgi:hypothetical protein
MKTLLQHLNAYELNHRIRKLVALFVFCFLISANLIFAQQEINTSFKNQMNYTFQYLEKNRVPYGVLLDFGMEFTNVPAFNGTLTDSTYVTPSSLRQIYNTLLMSRIRNVQTGFVTPQQFNDNWRNNRSSDYIALSGLYFKYSKFNDNAYPKKITFNNNQFRDKYNNGVWQNPYQEMQTFAITTPINFYENLSLTVKIPQNIFYSNASNTINRIEIDFADGKGYRTVAFNQLVNVNYRNSGNYIWKYKLVLTNGRVLYSHSKIKIGRGKSIKPIGVLNPKSKTQQRIVSDWVCDGSGRYVLEVEAEIAYLGQKGKATIILDDAGNDCQITNPLIVAEGFDIGSVLNPENQFGMASLQSFESSVFFGNSLNLRNLLVGDFFVPNDQDYDIIYVNWDNGVDYMQRNAYVLEEVIKWVNEVKVGDEQNVVLGQSMGGVIARYALSDMEARGEIHDTRLFISQDAPQQGANMPLSYQFMYRHLTNQYIQSPVGFVNENIVVPLFGDNALSNYASLLNLPAARQLLKNWSNQNYVIDNSLHDDFYNELRGLNSNNGYPQQSGIRNIAISNGSECGTTQPFNAGDHLVNIQMDKSLSFLQDLVFNIITPVIGVVGGALIDSDFFRVGFLGLIPGNSRFIIDFQAKALSYTNNAHIYKGLIRYKKKILWIFNSQVTITHVNKNQPSGILPFDFYGGGFFDTAGYNDTISFDFITDFNITVEVEDRFNFIPTASALDIGLGNVNLNNTDYLSRYVGGQPPNAPKNSPFDNFTTAFNNPNSDNNQVHLEFNRRNGDWLAAELIGTDIETTDCSFVCSNTTISGNDTICSSGLYSVSVPINNDITVLWSVNNANVILSNTTGNSTTVTNGGFRGTVTLSATITSVRCDSNITITKNIHIGSPSQPTYLHGPAIVNTGAIVNYSAGKASGATSYTWWLPYPFDVSNPIDYFAQNWQMATTTGRQLTAMTGYAENSGYVQVMGVNECGRGGAKILFVQHGNGGVGGGAIPRADPQGKDIFTPSSEKYFRIYPNPSNGIVNIVLKESNNKPLNQNEIQGKLFDLFGNIKRTVKIINNTANLNTKGLVTGVYVLKIYRGETIESHQLIVK